MVVITPGPPGLQQVVGLPVRQFARAQRTLQLTDRSPQPQRQPMLETLDWAQSFPGSSPSSSCMPESFMIASLISWITPGEEEPYSRA